ncbi:MAG: hypothetical protein Q8O00_10030 [Holophaga sp.]|nr:hypothetical protein [Holophaga sp.]
MPQFEIYNLVKWLHFVALALGGGGIVIALLLSGFEDEREDLRGLAATIWKKVVAWSFRLALILGILMLVVQYRAGDPNPLAPHYLHVKLLLVLILVGVSEMAPKALAGAKRGAAMLALLLFLLASFVTINRNVFPQRRPKPEAAPAIQTAPTMQAS